MVDRNLVKTADSNNEKQMKLFKWKLEVNEPYTLRDSWCSQYKRTMPYCCRRRHTEYGSEAQMYSAGRGSGILNDLPYYFTVLVVEVRIRWLWRVIVAGNYDRFFASLLILTFIYYGMCGAE